MTHYLTKGEWLRAVYLWQQGRNTLEVAETMDVPESLIYAKLPYWRGKYADIGSIAA